MDLIGQRFDRWYVNSFDCVKNGRSYWNCICICGTERSVSGYSLRKGVSRSCGCIQKLDITDEEKRLKRVKQTYRYNHNKHINWITFLKELGYTKCSECGYDKCYAALEFHHIDPNKKESIISKLTSKAFTKKNKQVLLKEISKCIPLCANCHRELHSKLEE